MRLDEVLRGEETRHSGDSMRSEPEKEGVEWSAGTEMWELSEEVNGLILLLERVGLQLQVSSRPL